MQAIGRQRQRFTTIATAGAELPLFIKDDFNAFFERSILAHGFPRLRCGCCWPRPPPAAVPAHGCTHNVRAGDVDTACHRFAPRSD